MSNNEKLDICDKALLRAAGVENPEPQYEEPETEQPVQELPQTARDAACTEGFMAWLDSEIPKNWSDEIIDKALKAYEAAIPKRVFRRGKYFKIVVDSPIVMF